jgi:hypothetical protein
MVVDGGRVRAETNHYVSEEAPHVSRDRSNCDHHPGDGPGQISGSPPQARRGQWASATASR